MDAKSNLNCKFGCFAVLAFTLISCMGEKGTPIKFSGAAYASDGNSEVLILCDEEQATTAGISAELSKKIFTSTVIECSNSTTVTHFYCYDDRNCNNDCVVRSAKKDGTDERREEKDSENKVAYLSGRIYWCPCE